jgi:ribosomal protein S18 acetylase RimI-like enzyme
MTSRTISNEQFLLLPLSIPSDAAKILHLHYQVNISDPFRKRNFSCFPSEEEFISTGLSSTISRFSNLSSLAYKFVPASDPDKLVAYVLFSAPHAPDTRSPQEREKALSEEISKSSSGLDKEMIFQLKTEDGALNTRFLGEGYEARFWELDVLVTDEGYQRRGLGTRLVVEGMREVERRVGEGEGEFEKTKVEGCYLVASQQGARTYE